MGGGGGGLGGAGGGGETLYGHLRSWTGMKSAAASERSVFGRYCPILRSRAACGKRAWRVWRGARRQSARSGVWAVGAGASHWGILLSTREALTMAPTRMSSCVDAPLVTVVTCISIVATPTPGTS